MKKEAVWNFYQFAQAGVDTEYLQPYPLRHNLTRELIIRDKEVDFVKDGQIERALHGGMHVGRASLLVLVLNSLLQQCFPEYSEESVRALSTALNIDKVLLQDLTRAAVIYHDSARENEGPDQWDKKSAKKLKAALTVFNFDTVICALFKSAAANKDAPTRFKEDCQVLLPAMNPQHCDYLRKLINLADCFDSIRCRGEFNFYYVIRQLDDIPGYSDDVHLPVFIQLGQNLHTVIWDQGDMYSDCKLVLEGKVIPTERTGAHFIRVRKVQFEHAPNVVSALAAHMMTYPYFKPMLEGEKLLCTDLAKVAPAFDPFIHGTQSGALAILKIMRDRQLSPEFTSPLGLVALLVAPMTGELSRRGANRKLVDSSMMCFGRLKLISDDASQYDYKKTLAYANQDAGARKNIDEIQERATLEFKYYLAECYRYGFTYINALMVYYLRAKQLGIDDQLLLKPEEKKQLLKRYRDTIAVYYLILLLEKHLRLNKELMDKLDWQRASFAREVAGMLSMNVLIDRIVKADIDVKAIYENPTAANLTQLLPLFALHEWSSHASKQWLVAALDDPQPCEIKNDTSYDFSMLTQNVEGWGIDSMLLHYIEHYPSSRAVVGMQLHAPQHIATMERCLSLLERVLDSHSENLLEDSTCRDLIMLNFPLMLLSEAEDAINISLFQFQEFRADRPLTFGKDITLIATDTRKHAGLLRKFLDQNGFAKVGITLFSELEAKKDLATRPSLLHIDDKTRFPTLAWMAAKAVVPGTIQARQGESLYDRLKREFESAEANYQEAQKGDNASERSKARRIFTAARGAFRRVEKWDELLGDAHAYHKAFSK